MSRLLSSDRSDVLNSSGTIRASGSLRHRIRREAFDNGLAQATPERGRNANTSLQGFRPVGSEIFQRPSDIADKPFFEVFPVAAFEGEFVVVDDRAAHGVTGMLKMAANFLDPPQSSTYRKGTPPVLFRLRPRWGLILSILEVTSPLIVSLSKSPDVEGRQGRSGSSDMLNVPLRDASGTCLACGLVGRPF